MELKSKTKNLDLLVLLGLNILMATVWFFIYSPKPRSGWKHCNIILQQSCWMALALTHLLIGEFTHCQDHITFCLPKLSRYFMLFYISDLREFPKQISELSLMHEAMKIFFYNSLFAHLIWYIIPLSMKEYHNDRFHCLGCMDIRDYSVLV